MATAIGTLTPLLTTLANQSSILTAFSTSLTGVNTAFAGGITQNMMILSTLSTGLDATTLSIMKMTEAFKELAGVNLSSISGIPWNNMTNFGKTPGGSIILAKNANNNFTIEKNTAKNLEHMDGQVTQLVQVNKNLQALLDAFLTNNGQSGEIRLQIDGKTVSRVIERRADNNTGILPGTGP
jgi:hypothetical protein